MIKPMDVTPEVSEALAHLRTYAAKYPTMGLSAALNVLDNAGVFATIDERNDYASAEEILAESALNACLCGGSFDGRRFGIGCTEQKPDPEEWGDTTRADMAQHVMQERIGAALQDDEDNPPVVDPDVARHQGLDTDREQILIRRAFGH